jgi:hypothetical protein
MGQNVNGISSGADTNTMVITNALAADALVAAQDCSTTGTQAVVTGEFLTVAGNDQPTHITAHHETGGDTDTVTLNEATSTGSYAVGGSQERQRRWLHQRQCSAGRSVDRLRHRWQPPDL